MYCLPKPLANKFIERLKDGSISPSTLSEMSSQERRVFFQTFMGEIHAKYTNSLFESKLLLKNQQQGMITWAKTVSGLKPEAQRDILSRVNKMTEILNPATEKAFLEDLVAHKLQTKVTIEQANKIAELAKMTMEKKEARDKGGDRLEYGRATVAFSNYVNELKENARKMTFVETMKRPGKLIVETGGVSRSVVASMDDSAIFRQGWKTLMTNPVFWTRNAIKTFADIGRTIGGKNIMNEVKADIFSRSYYDKMKKADLAVATIEEEFPSALPEKIPVIGRFYKASQDAYTAFLYRQRADVFGKQLEIAERSGVDTDDITELKSIGKLVNSLTGRGAMGILEPAAKVVNNVFFSPRLLKSHIDVLTAHMFDPKVSAFAKKQAAVNLVKIVSGTAAILVIAGAVRPGSVDWDPRSADFGKIKIGNTRFDVSGGMASIITLAARQITNSTKSSTTGLVKELGTGEFGESTRLDIVYNFFENKLAPLPAAIKNLLKARDFEGKRPTPISTLKDLFVPIIFTNYKELKDDPDSADMLLSMIAEGLGISTSTYSQNVDWSQNPGVVLQQFKEKVGEQRFKLLNDEFNKKFNSWFKLIQTDPRYKNLSDEDKQKSITKKKIDIKADIFKKNFFKYKSAPTKKLPNL